MSNVPLPEPHHQSAANFNAPDEPFYTADQMHAHAAAVSAAKDAEISGLQNFKTMHLEMVAKWAGDIGEALGEPSEDFKPDDLIALAGKVKIQRDALRADNTRLQNEVVMPLRERVRELTTQAMFNASTIERLRAEVAQLREWLEADARCPCCDTVDACLDDCTFATDCPQDAGRMAEVRALLAARKGEA